MARAAAGRGVAERLPSPFSAPFDIVIPWVDFGDVGYCAALGRTPVRSARGFTELKFLLRSLEQHGWLTAMRDVIVVHSDHHGPPPFLRRDHPRLRFLTHSAFAPAAFLPLRSLEQITAHLHRIPDLTPWFLFAEDDGLALADVDVFRRFAWRSDRLTVYSSYRVLEDTAPASASTWERGAAAASLVLSEAYGARARYLDLHTPHLLHRDTLAALAARWPSAPDGARAPFDIAVLHDELLIDERRATRAPYTDVRVDGRMYMREIHTNAPDLHPPATLRRALRLCALLAHAERRAMFLNLQGPGISAEFDGAGAEPYGAIADAWLARVLPTPSVFEAVSHRR